MTMDLSGSISPNMKWHDASRGPEQAQNKLDDSSSLMSDSSAAYNSNISSTMRRRKGNALHMKEIDDLEKSDAEKSHLYHLLREHAMSLYAVNEDLDKAYMCKNDLEEALREAQVIIEKQQEQLSDSRRRAAQTETDIESLKLRNIFNTPSPSNDVDQQQRLQDAYLQLESEFESIQWQLSTVKRQMNHLRSENEHLKSELQYWRNTMGREIHQTGAVHEDEFDNGHDILEKQYEALQNHVDSLQVTHADEVADVLSRIRLMETESKDWHQRERDLEENIKYLEAECRELRRVQKKHSERSSSSTIQASRRAMSIQDINSTISTASEEEFILELRRSNEEKNRWKSYACSLVRSFVQNCEEFVHKTPYEEPELHTEAERRWYDYSMYLLESMLEAAPRRLAERDLHLLKRSISARRPVIKSGPPVPDILSAVNFPTPPMEQTRKSKRLTLLRRKSTHSTVAAD